MEAIHVKLEAEEAINSRKTLLSTELSLLNTIKYVRDYRKLRELELKSKKNLKIELKKLNIEIKNLRKIIPKARIPETEEEVSRTIEKSTAKELEEELKEIKEKLAKLS